jgi:hypothetical protein
MQIFLLTVGAIGVVDTSLDRAIAQCPQFFSHSFSVLFVLD